ncbi:MAG: type II secretion system protein [Candidatus Saccharimonadales bacterium]
MGRPRRGYTIVEVLLTFAISATLFASAMILFNGQQGRTAFSQAMYDLDSKVKSYVAQVAGGTFPDSQNYTCRIGSSGRPVLELTTSNIGTNQECIFLGRAIQVIPDYNLIYIYPILGTRNQYSGSTDLGVAATSFDQTNAGPAVDNSGNFLLADEYKLLGSATVTSSTVVGQSVQAGLLGFYNSLQNDGVTSGSSSVSLVAKAYPFDSKLENIKSGELRACIEEAPPCDNLTDITSWSLCMHGNDERQSAVLKVNSLPSGVSTELSFTECT